HVLPQTRIHALPTRRSSDLEPGEQHRDWKSDRERNDNKTHCGIRNFKKREDLRCELREKPCGDSVSDRCAVNISPHGFSRSSQQIGRAPSELQSLAYLVCRL